MNIFSKKVRGIFAKNITLSEGKPQILPTREVLTTLIREIGEVKT